jgi:hypothetical protein
VTGSQPRPRREARAWTRVADALRAGISDKTFDPRRMPTARELAAKFGCGVDACRTALDDLADDGLITRLPLRSTVPADPAACAALGAILAALRLAAGTSPASLATATGYPVTAIRDAEAGRRDYPHHLWLALDDALKARGTLALAHASYQAPLVPPGPLPHVPDISGAVIAAEAAERELTRALEGARRHAGLSPDELARAARACASDVRRAEAGRLVQPRGFFADCDTALRLHGRLLRLYEQYARAIVRLRTDDADPAVLAAGAPPAAATPSAPGRAAAAVVIVWDDGTRSAAICHGAGEDGAGRDACAFPG